MVSEQSFLIDATFLLADAEKVFFGSAPLVDVHGRNTSVLYGAIREMLLLRRALGIVRGIVVVGADAAHVSHALNIELFLDLLKCIGTNVLHEPEVRVGPLCQSILLHQKSTIWLLTKNKSLMQLIDAQCGVILVSEGAVPEVITENSLKSNYHISPDQVPSFLALTDKTATEFLTAKQAVRLLEVYGALTAAFEISGSDSISPKTRRYLTANKVILQTRLKELTIIKPIIAQWTTTMATIVRIDEKSRQALKDSGFPSLARLLVAPENVELVSTAREGNHAYLPVIDQVGLRELERIVSSVEICAVDTESTDKDPRKASLLGVAFSVSEGKSFYVPVIEADLRDVSTESVIALIRRLLEGHVKVVGHNLKYDYVLLRRYGIRIQSIHFDTMLAAYECFGDWDFFNLGAVAKRLIGRDVKRYRDIVDEGQTFQDIPFTDLVEHGCADADATLRLYGKLRSILKEKSIDHQFENEVMPLICLLGDKELDGVCINISSITRARKMRSRVKQTVQKFPFLRRRASSST